jgi:HAE1 family hydrophobic/amphiphilic exporter-1
MSMALIVGGLFAPRLLPVAALPRTDFPPSISAGVGRFARYQARSRSQRRSSSSSTIEGINTISATSSQGDTSVVLSSTDRDTMRGAALQSAISVSSGACPRT